MSDSEDDLPPIPLNRNHVSNNSFPFQSKSRILKIQSFGHRFGPLAVTPPPSESSSASLHFNARTLPNPPKNIRLKCTGQNKSLQESFFAIPEVQVFFTHAVEVIVRALDIEDGPIHVAVCCEMGRHRSVAICERLAVWTWDKDVQVVLDHRDISRNKKK
ncbi:hypothetical protein BDR26DRAFT_804734 [Obelidium mucronatum]|nr:hypothetical protein BDR26DRAFT_804734 [Obelidium mucronatum]